MRLLKFLYLSFGSGKLLVGLAIIFVIQTEDNRLVRWKKGTNETKLISLI